MDKQTAQKLLDEMPDGTTHYDTSEDVHPFLKATGGIDGYYWYINKWAEFEGSANYIRESANVYTVEQLREIANESTVTCDEVLQWCVDNVTTWGNSGVTPEGWGWKRLIHEIILTNEIDEITESEWFDEMISQRRMNISVKVVPTPPTFAEVGIVQADKVLQRGIDHMKDRAATYDSPQGERSMNKTVKAFNIITGQNLTEEQGWLFMEVLKQVRSVQGDFKLDNYEDLAAYAGLRAEAAHNERTIVNE